jgi:retinoid hydroxylase
MTFAPLPPGTRGLPYVGETQHWARDPLRFAQERCHRYGPMFSTHLMGRPCAVMLGPEANRFMLSTHLHLFSSREGWTPSIISLIGGGLSLLDEEPHRRHRAMIQPALHGAALEHYFALMQATAARHAAEWLRQGKVALFEGFKRLSFDIAAALILGLPDGPTARWFFGRFATFNRGLFAFPALKLPWMHYGRAHRASAELRAFLQALVAERRIRPAASILDLLIAARDEDGKGLSDDELLDELLVLLWAGHDTITSLMTWTAYELLCHPLARVRLVAEQEEVVGTGPLSMSHLRQLPALDRVLREAERLHPPAPGGFRGVVAGFDYGGYHVPAGWTVMYSSVFTHRMPELWHEPDRFDPERFAPPRLEGRKPFQMVGFSAGPRVCVGKAFAQMQMRIVLSELLRRLELALLPGQRFDPVAVPTPMPRDGLLVTVSNKATKVPPAMVVS